MADDLEELRARVAAARDRLTSDVDVVQKVELRLNDLARIVEGSLARQSAELDAAKARIATLDVDLERALARAEQAAGDAARSDRLAKENGDLKTMVMTLLEVIEGRQKTSLASVMQKLEENVTALVITEALPLGVELDGPDEVNAPVEADAPAEAETPAEAPAAMEAEAPIEADAPLEADAPVEPDAAVEPEAAADPDAWDEVLETPTTAEPEQSEEIAPDVEMEPVEEVELEAAPEEATEDEAIDAPLREPAPKAPIPTEEVIEDLSELELYDAAAEVVEPEK
jgi:hypothetical protein